MVFDSKLLAALVAGALWLPATAAAQQASTDPAAGTPAGTIYELPLDSARGDAAPKGPVPAPVRRHSRARGGAATGAPVAPGGSPTPSAIRSENGFGSSTVVPGVAAGRTGGARAHSGSGSSSGASATSAGAHGSSAPTAFATSAAQTDTAPSALRTYALLALALVVGTAMGLSTRASRRVAG